VRLWDAGQVRSLASYLRQRSRVASLQLQSPQPDVTDAPGMVAAVSELLYGNPIGGDGGDAIAETDGAVPGAGAGFIDNAVVGQSGAAGGAAADGRGGGGDGLVAGPVASLPGSASRSYGGACSGGAGSSHTAGGELEESGGGGPDGADGALPSRCGTAFVLRRGGGPFQARTGEFLSTTFFADACHGACA
jgi:hypothetical protein